MKITNQQNYSYKNPSFGYNFPKYINEFPKGRYCTIEESFKTKLESYRKNGCMEAYYKLLNNMQKFKKARFDATQLIEKYRPIMQQYGVEDKFDDLLKGFNSETVIGKDGKKHVLINASVSDVFINAYKKSDKTKKLSGDLSKYYLQITKNRGLLNIPGHSGFSVDCGYELPVVDEDVAPSECFAKKYLAEDCFDDLQDDINNAISEFFIKKCEKLKKEGAESISNMSDADIKKLVDADFDKFFKSI